MASTRGRLLVLGGNPLHGSDAQDSRMGAGLWDLSLGQRTGDRRLDGEAFSGRLWIFFLGGWGRGRGLARAILQSCFRRRRAGLNGPMFIVYYIFTQWNFRCCMLQPSRVVPPILDALGSARALFRLRQPVDLGRIEDGEGSVILVPPRTPRRSGYVVYADAVYVVICYM